MADTATFPVRTIAECDALLTGPGAKFEMEEKVIGGPSGVPLAAAISPYGHREPQVDLMPQDTASGARFGLDDDAPLADVAEVPVGGSVNESPASANWVPPSPRAALDPLTAPYEQLQRAETPLQAPADDEKP